MTRGVFDRLPPRRHAVVIGASLAGLLAARVLAGHFREVTLIERDALPAKPAPRKGVPQARHNHILLLRGRQLLERLFPGLQDELLAAGAVLLDVGADLAWLLPSGWGVRFASGLVGLACSRDLLEWHVRRRITAPGRVRIVDGCAVSGLLAEGTAIGGVATALETLPADWVVDAGGRGSRLPQWLEALGYAPPPETTVNAFFGYASRIYRPQSKAPHWKGLYLQAAPPATARLGVILPIEGGRWLVTLSGAERDYPPTDEAGFLEFAASLRSPALHEAIKDAEPLSPIYASRSTDNRWRHYEQLARWPERLSVLGDAVCAFNPVYGQGMTVAATSAMVLDRCLREGSRRFQPRLARAIATPWTLATAEDYRYPATEGVRPGRRTRLLHRYLDRMTGLMTEDVETRRTFLEVMNLLRSPAALFRPRIAARALWRARPESQVRADPEAPPAMAARS